MLSLLIIYACIGLCTAAFAVLVKCMSSNMQPRGLSAEAIDAIREQERLSADAALIQQHQRAFQTVRQNIGVELPCVVQNDAVSQTDWHDGFSPFTRGYYSVFTPDAQTRSITLMKEWLSPEQLASYEAHTNFIVTAKSGNRYRINHGGISNVDQLDAAGNTVAHLCFQPGYCSAVGDIMLAQKVMLETDEAAALRIANRTEFLRHPSIAEAAALIREAFANSTRVAFAGSMQREMERANYRNNGL